MCIRAGNIIKLTHRRLLPFMFCTHGVIIIIINVNFHVNHHSQFLARFLKINVDPTRDEFIKILWNTQLQQYEHFLND